MSVDLKTVTPNVPNDGHYVYWCWDYWPFPPNLPKLIGGQDLMYIGATSSLRSRLEKHASSSEWWPFVERVSFSHPFPTRADAFEHERICIAHERPLFNQKGC